jgi:RNA polymerase sigma-70 factor (ECF subfamily)
MRPTPFVREVVISRSLLLRAASARLRNGDWAEDAVSETLLAAFESPPAFDDPGRVRAWLFGILRHKLVDQLRRNGGKALVVSVGDRDDLECFQGADSHPKCDPVRRLGDSEFLADLARALEQLPPRQAAAVVMTDGWGSSTSEVCAELGASAGNVWVLVHRARTRLKASLHAHRS